MTLRGAPKQTTRTEHAWTNLRSTFCRTARTAQKGKEVAAPTSAKLRETWHPVTRTSSMVRDGHDDHFLFVHDIDDVVAELAQPEFTDEIGERFAAIPVGCDHIHGIEEILLEPITKPPPLLLEILNPFIDLRSCGASALARAVARAWVRGRGGPRAGAPRHWTRRRSAHRPLLHEREGATRERLGSQETDRSGSINPTCFGGKRKESSMKSPRL